jgi:hypothetical protein
MSDHPRSAPLPLCVHARAIGARAAMTHRCVSSPMSWLPSAVSCASKRPPTCARRVISHRRRAAFDVRRSDPLLDARDVRR